MLHALVAVLLAAPVPAEDWSPKTFKLNVPRNAGPNATAVAVSADGKLVAAGFNGVAMSSGARGAVRVWNAETGKLVTASGTRGDIVKVAFGAEGRSVVWGRLLVPGEGRADVGVMVRGFGPKVFTATPLTHAPTFAVSPDGKRIALSLFDRVELRDLATDAKLDELKGFPNGHGFAFTSDGKQLLGARLVGEDAFRLIRRDVNSEAVVESEKLAGHVYTVAVAPDGRQAATGHPAGVVRVWDAKWKEVRTFETKTLGRAHPFFSPDGRFLAAGDQTSGEVVVWERATGKEVRRFVFEAGDFQPVSVRGRDERFRPEMDPARFAFHPGSRAVLVGCHGAQLVALHDGKVIRTFGTVEE